MDILNAKVVSGGRFLAACCPFCVDSGKEPDTKYHLYVSKGKYAFCYRCGFKKSYEWLIANYSINVIDSTARFVREDESSASDIDTYLSENTVTLSGSFSSLAALSYLKRRGISGGLLEYYGIRLGIKDLHGRVVFVDAVNKYFMGRSYISSVKPKTFNPPAKFGINRPLMYYRYGKYSTVWLVEGVFDSVYLNASGNVVWCLLGKDMSNNQVDQLSKSFIGNIIIALDADAYVDANRLADRVAGFKNESNVGVMTYKDLFGKNKDPGEYGFNIFSNIDVVWNRIINKEAYDGFSAKVVPT